MAEEIKIDDIVVIEEPSNQQPAPQTVSQSDDELAEHDESLRGDVEEAEELAVAGESDEDAEQRRQRNRKMREERKERRRAKEDSYRRELQARDAIIQEQNERLAALERRSQGADMAQIDHAIKQSADAYGYFKQQHALAVEQANGQAAADATEKMLQAQNRYNHLTNIKQQATRQQQAPQPLDPRLRQHAENWMSRNQWYNPSGGDEDSDIMLTIDARMAREGWDPRQAEYWQELDARAKKYLPHRYNRGYNSERGGSVAPPPVTGSGRDSAPSGKATYKLSPERKQAMIAAGIYDDPVKRNEQIKAYMDYDKRHGLI